MFKCHRCGKTLVSKQAYTYHMNRKRPCTVSFGCSSCEETFKTKFDLSIHKMSCCGGESCKGVQIVMEHGKVAKVIMDQRELNFTLSSSSEGLLVRGDC